MLGLRYAGEPDFPGKPPLPGLPSTYAKDPAETDTLEIELADEKTGLRLVLCYNVFPQFDAMVRSLTVTNGGAGTLDNPPGGERLRGSAPGGRASAATLRRVGAGTHRA